jgi:hypothetical protein
MDTEYINQLKEVDNVKYAFNKLNLICQTFTQNFKCNFINLVLAQYNRDISEVIFLLYNNTPEYKEFQYTLTDIHIKINNLFLTITKDISEIMKSTKSWVNYFKNIKDIIEKRDEAKKVYEHYEQKVINLENHYRKQDRLNANHAKRKLERVINYEVEFQQIQTCKRRIFRKSQNYS